MATATQVPVFLESVPTAPTDTWLCWCGYVNQPDSPCGRCLGAPRRATESRRGIRRVLHLP